MFHVKHFVIAILMVLAASSFCFGATNAQQVDFLLSGSLKADGTVNSGGKVYTCDAGTVCGPSTSNPKTTWTDATKATPSANPVILDSLGKATVYADGNYKLQIYGSDDTLIETLDNVQYEIAGDTSRTVTTLTPSSAAVSSTDDTLLCNTAAGSFTVDFSGMSAVGNSGKRFTFKKIDASAFTCTIDPSGSQTLDQASTAILSARNQTAIIESDGANWIVVKPFLHDHSDDSLGGDLDSVAITNATLLDATLSGAPSISNFSSAVHTHADLVNGGVLFPYQDERANFSFIANTGVFQLSDGNYSVGFQNIVVGWTGDIAWVANSTGTNANSDEMAVKSSYYIGIDNSVATLGTALTNSAFIGNTTAPIWNSTYNGWYTGNNRVIMAVFANSPNNALEFAHDGGSYVSYGDSPQDLSPTDIDTTWTDVTLTLPGFCTKASVNFWLALDTGAGTFQYWRPNGSTVTTGQVTNQVDAGVTYTYNEMTVFTDTSQKIEIIHADSDAEESALRTNGWFFPKGM